LWDVKTGLKLHEVSFDSSGNQIYAEISPDAKQFLIERGIWDTFTGQLITKLGGLVTPLYDETGKYLLFSPDGKYVFVEGAKQDLLVDAKNFSPVRTLESTSVEDDIFAWKFSPNGKYLAATEAQEAALIWDVETGKRIHRLVFVDRQPQALFFNDGKRILLPERSKESSTYTIYDLVGNKELKKIALADDNPTQIIISPDDQYVLTRADLLSQPQSILQIWDVETGKLVGEYC
jgi:WD40 repeat protein